MKNSLSVHKLTDRLFFILNISMQKTAPLSQCNKSLQIYLNKYVDKNEMV